MASKVTVNERELDIKEETLSVYFDSTAGTFKCTLCDAAFSLKEDIDEHTLTHIDAASDLIQSSTDNTEYKCQFCTNIFLNINSLKRHLKIHTDSENYQCQYCELSFLSL